MTSAPAIGFEYRPSRGFRYAVASVAILAIFAVILSGLPVWLKLLLSIGVLLFTWQRFRQLAHSTVSAVGWNADDKWVIHTSDHEDVPAVLASFRVIGALVLLRLTTRNGGAQVLLLTPDNSDADIRRRLRMRLATLQPGASDERA